MDRAASSPTLSTIKTDRTLAITFPLSRRIKRAYQRNRSERDHNPNRFLVFGFTDADLAKFGVDEFVPREVAAIPEPKFSTPDLPSSRACA